MKQMTILSKAKTDRFAANVWFFDDVLDGNTVRVPTA